MNRTQTRQELAEKIRNEHVKSSRRFKLTTMLFVLFGVLACVVVLVWIQIQPEDLDEATGPNNATESYGFKLTKEVLAGAEELEDSDANAAEVLLYEDFLCDSCKIFHEETGSYLTELVEQGKINLTFQPFTFLLTQSTDEYSQRASNAAVCVADSAGVLAYSKMHDLLMKNQPKQGGAGLSDEQLIQFAADSGADDVSECIKSRNFDTWVEEAMQAGLKAEVSSTPTVRVNGLNVVKQVDGKELMPGITEIDFALEITH